MANILIYSVLCNNNSNDSDKSNANSLLNIDLTNLDNDGLVPRDKYLQLELQKKELKLSDNTFDYMYKLSFCVSIVYVFIALHCSFFFIFWPCFVCIRIDYYRT